MNIIKLNTLQKALRAFRGSQIKFALLAFALAGCAPESEEIEIIPKEKIEGFSYFERETYKLQFPSEWVVVEPGKDDEEKLKELDIEIASEYEWEAEGNEAAWYIKDGADGKVETTLNLVSSAIKGLKFNDFSDEQFAEDFIKKNDEDLVALFGTTGELAFIEPSSLKTFDGVYAVSCKYKLYSEPEDLCFYRVVFCADDSVNYLMLITGERLFDNASSQMDLMVNSIERTANPSN
jgi:hypothetical protein